MKTMNHKIAEIAAEIGKKTALHSLKSTPYYFFNEPKMPKCLICKQK